MEGVLRVLDRPPRPDPSWNAAQPNPATSSAPYRLYNIGSNRPIELLHYIELLEEALGRTASKILLPMQPGDVADTFADVSELVAEVGYRPTTRVEDGIKKFVEWFTAYYPAQAPTRGP